MTTADDLDRAKASVLDSEPIPIRRFGQVPPMATRARVEVAAPAPRLRGALATGGWLLMMALAVGMVLRFGH